MALRSEDMSKMGQIIKDNLGGTAEDNRFIDNLVFFSEIVETKETGNEVSDKVCIENNRACIEERINEVREYIKKPDNQTNGIEHINRRFAFLNDASYFGNDKEGNFYLFVANVKIKAAAFLLRTYLFIQKYTHHEDAEYEKSMKEARDYVWTKIEENIKDKSSLVEKISKKVKQSDYELKDYKFDNGELVEEKKKEGMVNNSYSVQEVTYKLTKETAYDLNECFRAKKISDLEGKAQLLDRITVLFDINNKIDEIIDKKNISELLKKDSRSDNRSLRYFIFDNSMREVEFYGVESRFNWLWEQEENVYLYRNVSQKQANADTNSFEGMQGMEYMKTFMNRLISHINGDNYMQAISYSRNPIRDFYKYIDIPAGCDPITISFILNVDENAEVKVAVDHEATRFDENNKAVFEIVKNAVTNSLAITKQNGNQEEISFYNFLKKSKDEYNKTKFCIEFCKENAVVPACTGRRLLRLRNYLETWGVNKSVNFYVVSDNDDEVVTSIDFFGNTDSRPRQFSLNFIQILSVMYQLFKLEDNIFADENKLDDKIRKCIQNRYEAEMKLKINEIIDNGKNLTDKDYDCNGGIFLKIIFNDGEKTDELYRHRLEQNLKNEIDHIPEMIADIILKKIKKNYDSELICNVVSGIEKGIDKKANYRAARKAEFNFFTGGNAVLGYWKQIFKNC